MPIAACLCFVDTDVVALGQSARRALFPAGAVLQNDNRLAVIDTCLSTTGSFFGACEIFVGMSGEYKDPPELQWSCGGTVTISSSHMPAVRANCCWSHGIILFCMQCKVAEWQVPAVCDVLVLQTLLSV